MGEKSGYLAAMAALATGADRAIVSQENFTENDVKQIVKDAIAKVNEGLSHYTIVKSEGTSEQWSCKRLKDAIKELDKENQLSVRIDVLCHAQEGGSPSAFDRQMGLRKAIYAFQGFMNPRKMGDSDCCVLGLVGRTLKFSPVSELVKEVCFPHRLPLKQWWIPLIPLIGALSEVKDAIDEEKV
ncbi:hypothetical protein OESDEN_23025 [Oesophagostomum dentatum]|uniref:Phosphofructokinase domain-containing protein n=1 Tax=Oesophagostomum dentatum TaxID=61180 RepID=A0A0B1S2A1_OESDE|nr:hypothetical protein OESDEN_23025 [Oesophagostomum dentatum]